MIATAYAQSFGLDAASRAALEAAAVTTARRAFAEAPQVARVEVFIAQETPGGRRWRVVVDALDADGRRVAGAHAVAPRPHIALEDACVAAWASLRDDARAA